MEKIERHPAPEKLLQQIATETVTALALGGADKIEDTADLEAGVALIAKAWDLPQESWQASAGLIQKEKQLILSGSSEDALPESEMMEPYDGRMIAELIWGLFETAVRLEDAQNRETIYKLALTTAEALNFDDWIEECGPRVWAAVH